MKKRQLLRLIPFIFFIFLITYLWYARASIYWKLGDLPIFAPSDYASYSIGPESKTPRTYVAIGDSLTAGVGVDSYVQSYPYIIATEISKKTQEGVKLVPFAIPGIRSEYVVGYFLDPVIASKPDIVTLFIGTNDIHGNVPNRVFKEHYEVILQRLTKETDAEIYIVNLPYIGTKDLISAPYRYYFNWRTEQYNSIIKDLGTQYQLTYIDLYSAHAPQSLDNTFYARDFFHPNAVGYALWAKHIYASFNN